jgi:ubiquinone/menaquinone biosynthesis C-methylase UbiE
MHGAMPNESKYSAEVARAYDLLVHGCLDAEADAAEMAFLAHAFGQVCRRPVEEVLDVGCGTGYWLLPLARSGRRVTGIDTSVDMLRECRRKLAQAGLHAQLERTDMLELRAEDAFDAALCMTGTLCYLLEADRIVAALDRLRRALRPGGVLVIENANLCAQWYCHDEPFRAVRQEGDMRIAYSERHWYEDFPSVYHIDLDARVEEGGCSYEFRREEMLRAMTVGEVTAYLRAAGFGEVRAYPSFDLSLAKEKNSDRMVLLAVKPG